MKFYIANEFSLSTLTSKKVNIGDYIFLCDDNSISLYNVCNNQANFNTNNGSLLLIDTTKENKLQSFEFAKSKLIFSFDNCNRKGNYSILQSLKESFKNKSVKTFIDEAMKITTFNSDDFELYTLKNLFRIVLDEDLTTEIFKKEIDSKKV